VKYNFKPDDRIKYFRNRGHGQHQEIHATFVEGFTSRAWIDIHDRKKNIVIRKLVSYASIKPFESEGE
jgi:hypothetical protein